MQTYQLNSQSLPWHRYRYTIKTNDTSNTPLYQVRRTGFRKYRQFEDVNSKILFYIGIKTIKSIENEQTLAIIKPDGKTIETTIGTFTLNDVNICQGSYILKLNDIIIAQVSRQKHSQFIIEMNQQYQAFIFAILVLINSSFDTIQNPTIHSHLIQLPFK